MQCEWVRARLGAWADGELSEPSIPAHLEECPACRSALDEIRALDAFLVEHSGECPAASAPQIRLLPGPIPVPRTGWFAAAAAALLLAASGFEAGRRLTNFFPSAPRIIAAEQSMLGLK